MKTVCVIGNFSGRNAGDAAILEALLHDIHTINKNVHFLIPTINTKFINKTYKHFPIKPVAMMPWNLSLKIFGVPIFRAVLQSDLVLVTDAILFDKKLWNPVFNYLSTMALVLPLAKRKKIPVVLYNVSLGPVTTVLGKLCFKKVLDSSELVITRDTDSIKMLKDMQISNNNVKLAADCALNTSLPSPERMAEIKSKEGILEDNTDYISINVNAYLDIFVKEKKQRIGTDQFVTIMTKTIDRIIEHMGSKVIMIVTQHMDRRISENILNRLKYSQGVKIISNKKYTHNEIAGILSEVGIHVGMRTHSIILATASCTPTVAIVYRPKNRGYMKTIQQEERIMEFGAEFTSDNLYELIRTTWNRRKQIRAHLEPIIQREKEKARQSAQYLQEYLT